MIVRLTGSLHYLFTIYYFYFKFALAVPRAFYKYPGTISRIIVQYRFCPTSGASQPLPFNRWLGYIIHHIIPPNTPPIMSSSISYGIAICC